jgi:hypothetical protein
MPRKKTVDIPTEKPEVDPLAPTDLLTLNEAQAAQVMKAIMAARQAEARAKELNAKVTELLSMVAPPGANGFDFERMTFQSIPPEPPKED